MATPFSNVSATRQTTFSSQRAVVRTSAGIPVVIRVEEYEDTEVSNLFCHVGNAATPTAWTRYDDPVGVRSTRSYGFSVAIDANDIVWILTNDDNTGIAIRSVDPSTGTFGGGVLVSGGMAEIPAGTFVDAQPLLSLAVDSNGDLQCLVTGSIKNMGTKEGVLHVQKLTSVSFSSGTVSLTQESSASILAGTASNIDGSVYPICGACLAIDGSDIPVVSYVEEGVLKKAVGNASLATSFTVSTLDASAAFANAAVSGALNKTSCAFNGSGDFVVAYGDGNNTICVNDGGTKRDSGVTGYDPSLIINGTDYVIVYEDANNDIAYIIWDGSSWSSATVIATGTYHSPTASADVYSGGFDYVYYDESTLQQAIWDYQVLTPPTPKYYLIT